MQLTLANFFKDSSGNYTTTLSDPQTSQILYKISTKSSTTIVACVTPSNDPGDMQDQFRELAQIEYHTFSPSVIKFWDREVPLKEFFDKEVDPLKRLKASGNSLWRASDGETYVWKLEFPVIQAVYPLGANLYHRRDDGEEVPVIVYHPPKSYTFSRKAPEGAVLEISPAIHGILDEIIMAYVYYAALYGGWGY